MRLLITAFAAILAFAAPASAQRDPAAAWAAQNEIAAILGRSSLGMQMDFGYFEDAVTFSVQIRSACENTIRLQQRRLERNGRYSNARAVSSQFIWGNVTRIVAANVNNLGPGALGVAIYRGDEYNAYGVNNAADQQQLAAAMERLRLACRPSLIEEGNLGAVGAWRRCHYENKHQVTNPGGVIGIGALIRRFDFDVSVAADGSFTAQGTVQSLQNPAYNGPFRATGTWRLSQRRLILTGTWTGGGTPGQIFEASFGAYPGERLGFGTSNRYTGTEWQGGSCNIQ